ncbi:MOB kinase activator 1A [Hondaea fermentalgiana]|uniref:MOB kinase activator 1A n=1 Tax=Hondaea fermentalgiana TaxID=2315210 RepID=A0A2R5GF85_9STRA|nr:MOB kinase activator 1A [Hondaea fermentalgiana]|eukprot:GBG26901.1 MOB kinase activator 1A [Hondaea fermentalgiana]
MNFKGLLSRGGNGEKKTLKPVKKHATMKRQTLSKLTQRTLGSGNLALAVQLPEGEDLDEWLAANTVDFFNEISLLYGLVIDDAAQFQEPGSGFPPGFEYRWGETNSKKPIRVSSPEYVDYVMTWVEDMLDNEEIFPTMEEDPFPENFLDYIKDIYKRLFRIFAIIYHRHFHVFEELEAQAHLNTCFKHFLFFCLNFDLVDDKELLALEGPVKRLKEEYKEQGAEGE